MWSAKILEVVPFDIPISTCFALNYQYILKYWEPTSPAHRTGISLCELDSTSHFGSILVRDSAKIDSWMKAGVDILIIRVMLFGQSMEEESGGQGVLSGDAKRKEQVERVLEKGRAKTQRGGFQLKGRGVAYTSCYIWCHLHFTH